MTARIEACIFLLLICSSSSTATSVSYYGDLIEFNFTRQYTVSQSVNGDYWVHNNDVDVIVTSITPTSQVTSDRTINGSMVNPFNDCFLGYDTPPGDMLYDNELNVDPGNTGQPLVAAPGASVVKAISTANGAGRPIISDAADLTVLVSSPPADSFRPHCSRSDKSAFATVNDIDFIALGRHLRLRYEPTPEYLAHDFARVWLEYSTDLCQRDSHPANHMPAYGRDIANKSDVEIVVLLTDYSAQEKLSLMISL
jgi:hypothetical protein